MNRMDVIQALQLALQVLESSPHHTNHNTIYNAIHQALELLEKEKEQ